MQVELKHLQQQLGITFIFVTHDQEEALTMSNRICIMNNGKIEQVGTQMKSMKDQPLNSLQTLLVKLTYLMLKSKVMKADKLKLL